jgi:hypothetical protein
MVSLLDREAALELASSVTILEASIDEIPVSPLFPEFLEYWQELRGDRFAPNWNDFDPVKFASLWKHMVLWDIEGDLHDFRVRMAGVDVVRFFGNDATGQSIRDETFTPPELFEQFYLFHKLSALWSGPVGFVGNLWYWKDKNHIPVKCLTLPLSKDGKFPAQTINMWDFEGRVTDD